MSHPQVHFALRPGNDPGDGLFRNDLSNPPTGDPDIVRQPSRIGLPYYFARDLRVLAEFATLSAALGLSALAFPQWAGREAHSLLLAAALWLSVYAALNALSRPMTLDGQSSVIAEKIGHWCKAGGVVIVIAFVAKGNFELSRLWIGVALALGCLLLALLTHGANRLSSKLHRAGSLGDRLAIYGTNGRIDHLVQILRDKSHAYQIDSIYGDPSELRPRPVAGINVGYGLDELIERAQAGHIDAILLNLPWSEQRLIDDVVTRLEEVNVDVLLAPSELQLARRSLQITRCGPFATIALYQRPIQGLGAIVKIIMDRSLAALGLMFFAPLMLLVAIAIKLGTPGPVFFHQPRRGMNNQPFNVLKFRTMFIEATDVNADRLVSRGDPRVTKLGAFLRRTSIDELPQLINILRGEMSLVGPRPHAYGAKAADRLYEEVVSRYPARHRVLPGLTGLAQVRGYRGGTPHEQDIINRIDSDLEYIERWSISLDLVIVARTVLTLLFHRQAY